MRKKTAKRILLASISIIALGLIAALVIFYILDQKVTSDLKAKKLIQTSTYYSSSPEYEIGMILPPYFEADLDLFLRKRNPDQTLLSGDYRILSKDLCLEKLGRLSASDEVETCFEIFLPTLDFKYFGEPQLLVLATDNQRAIRRIYFGDNHIETSRFHLPPQPIVEYLGADPILRRSLTIGEFPPDCLKAIISIEDSKFLEHSGISYTGILRALLVNVFSGRPAQGGSTITQQLVKNYFLTPERTLKRKFLEFFISIIIENRASKDEILETYLNVIYLGQQGVFQVRGYGAAAEFYFAKEISDLNLQECALMAAIVNSPGTYNPFTKPENAKKRRGLVLSKMAELGHISKEEQEVADRSPLPTRKTREIFATAPYFIEAVQRQVTTLGLETDQAKRIFTSLDLHAQEFAQKAVQSHLQKLESNSPRIKKIAETKKIQLEGLLISSDLKTGLIRALVGGRSYRSTQYNRALDSKRQIGSTMKPLVYLTALKMDPAQYHPLAPLEDRKFTHRYEGQKWSPDNYDKLSHGTIPLYYGLKESLNIATAKLGIDIGLENIITTARDIGVTSPLAPVPSLTLGAFEMQPIELFKVYTTLANLGESTSLSFIEYIENEGGEEIFSYSPYQHEVIDRESASVLVGMMKETIRSGTAQAVQKSHFPLQAAGKTGTTSDNKDTWFAAFTPHHLALVWTGFDSAQSTGLTGASGSVPIWLSYMSNYAVKFPNTDFQWSENTETRHISKQKLSELGIVPEHDEKDSFETELIFLKNQPPF